MQRSCSQCQASFDVTDDDLAFYDKVSPVFAGKKCSIPPPKMCFQCRLQRRTAFYNARSLYRRTCDSSGKSIVSIYSPDKPFKVYDKDVWFGDSWSALSYGRDFDFNRPFFPQFRELMEAVPQLSISHFGWPNINSDFTNDNYKIKNCYLTFDGEQAEDCYYGHSFVHDKNCIDFLHLTQSELCYECIHCTQSYGLRYSRYCNNCSSSEFLRDCIGCKNCFGCANLRQKQFCIFNEQKSQKAYDEFIHSFDHGSTAEVNAMRRTVEEFFLSQPVKAARGEQNVNVMGDNMNESKNGFWCFDCNHLEDCRYATNCMMQAKDLCDVHVWGDGLELAYESCVVGADARALLFDFNVSQSCNDILYSAYCSQGCSHLFGCVGLRHAQYCIFNTQYSPQEYDTFVCRIIDCMTETGEWGNFFPTEFSFFGYNETMAQTYFPLSRDDCIKHGWQWCDFDPPVEAVKTISAVQLPDDQKSVPDDVLNWALLCEVTGRPFKIIRQELDFYRTHHLPLPRRHPDQRHVDRFRYKNPFVLWKRKCAKCSKEIETSYSPDRKEIIYCQECYLKEVY